MKSKVLLSNFCVGLTVAIEIVFLAVLYFTYSEPVAFILWGVILIGTNLAALWYMPLSVECGVKALKLHTPLRTITFPYTEIASVERIQPTMGAVRVFASGGFLGYWGLFRERTIGKYHAAYGRASDCFLITLKDGTKWMLGCYNPDRVVALIRTEIAG